VSVLRILMVGDVVGNRGRHALEKSLYRIVDEEKIDFVVANGENAGSDLVMSPESAIALLRAGVDVLTGGNHTSRKTDVVRYMNKEPKLLRPYNFPESFPGRGWAVFPCGDARVAVLSLQGRVFMGEIANPFHAADRALNEIEGQADVIVVDFHAEATSEKIAMSHYLDGRVAAVFGTHTHVQTADARLLPKGTAAITDVGMTGPVDSIIGVKKEISIARFLDGRRRKLEVAGGSVQICGAVLEADTETGLARGIKSIAVQVDV